MIINDSTRLRAIDHHLRCQIRDESVLLDLGQGKYYALNTVGARIWEILQSTHTVGDVLATIVAEYDVSHDDCQRDVLAVVGELMDFGLLDTSV
jgi:hypothetical protein